MKFIWDDGNKIDIKKSLKKSFRSVTRQQKRKKKDEESTPIIWNILFWYYCNGAKILRAYSHLISSPVTSESKKKVKNENKIQRDEV